jgi:thiosulfate reductase cytochrome b subunit
MHDKAEEEEKVLYPKHPLAVRWFHWINFPVLFIMIWSGLMIYWANSVFWIRLPFFTWGPLFPDAWWTPKAPGWVPKFLTTMGQDDAGHSVRQMYDISGRLAEGMAWHFLFVWFFAINGLLYVTFLILSKEWKLLVPKPAALIESIHVVLYDLHLTRRPLPVRKYNAAQQIAYTGVILMGGLMLVTGLAIYKPSEQSWLTQLLGGYTVTRFLHFWTTMGFLGFFLIHVGQVIKTGWNNFRGMITGYELVTKSEAATLSENS